MYKSQSELHIISFFIDIKMKEHLIRIYLRLLMLIMNKNASIGMFLERALKCKNISMNKGKGRSDVEKTICVFVSVM